jgi:hypothetical protein
MRLYLQSLIVAAIVQVPFVTFAQALVTPELISHQGFLTDSLGSPVNSSYPMTFALYSGATKVWQETHASVSIDQGLFNVLLGSQTAFDTLSFGYLYTLGIKVNGGPELSPRSPLGRSPYALNLRGIRIEPNEVNLDAAPSIIAGDRRNGKDDSAEAVTISGGGGIEFVEGPLAELFNYGSGHYATIGGGLGNTAGQWSTVGGGVRNLADEYYATVGGGTLNIADGFYATVPGGRRNKAVGEAAFAAGQGAQAIHNATFVWNSTTSNNDSLKSTAANQFIIGASGGVGIGTNAPLTQLHVVDNLNASASAPNHVALIDNTSTGSGADVLALRIGRDTNPGNTNSFITFIYNDPGAAGFIRGAGNGGIELVSNGADYAEYLPHLNRDESVDAGDVVGVFGGHVSRRTQGADQVMVVSTAPIVVGNRRADGESEKAGYSKIAFIGQAPVNVLGPVKSGDFLIPSGLDDGTAVAVDPTEIKPEQIRLVFATAWESNGLDGPVSINAAIGIDQSAAALRAIEALQAKDRLRDLQILSMMERLALLESADNGVSFLPTTDY